MNKTTKILDEISQSHDTIFSCLNDTLIFENIQYTFILCVLQEPSVQILYDAMYQLTLEPGRFDSIARQLTEDLNSVIKGW